MPLRRQKQITEMNQQMAERLLSKESHFDYKAMRKSMEQYERIKKTMINNKKAMATLQPLPSIAPKKESMRNK